MDLFDETLPGAYIDVEPEDTASYDTSLWGTTDVVMVIGTAFDGPTGKYKKIYSPEHAEYIYGKAYDTKTRREATLTPAIKDAWDRGCRSILACRIGGKEIYKDFEFSKDTNLMLRVKGMFPSNNNKNVYMVFDNEAMTISIYKPADRATIAEIKAGLVENVSSVIKTDIDLDSNGIDENSDLSELISIFNKYTSNNVLQLYVVDTDGNDVTLSSDESKALKVGDLFPGIYTIGRSANAEGVIADTKLEPVFSGKPYADFDGKFYKKLSLNTNVSRSLPLYSEERNLNEILGISSATEYEFLSVLNKIDDYFVKDKIDYEEVDLTDFEIYKKLGRGFADNAIITYEEKTLKNGQTKAKFRVKPVTDKDTKRSAIEDGIYSVIENVPCALRVLAGVDGEKQIKGSLPKPIDFKFCSASTVKMLNNSVAITAKVDKTDLTEPVNYQISFEELSNEELKEILNIKDKLYKGATAREASVISFADIADNKKDFAEGSIFLVKDAKIEGSADKLNLLYTYSDKNFTPLHQFVTDADSDILKDSLVFADGKLYKCSNNVINSNNNNLKMTSFVEVDKAAVENNDYFIVSLQNATFVVAHFTPAVEATADHDAIPAGIKIIGTLGQVLDYDEDKLLISMTNNYGVNKIVVKSSEFDFLTIEEVIDLMNDDDDFQKLFEAKIIDTEKAQDSISDLDDIEIEEPQTSVSFVDRKIGYDTNLLIPYKTEDTFARQFAQHCYYTSLKTGSTHGIIGTKLLLDTSPEAITNKVNELVSTNFANTLFAKKSDGKTMLGTTNQPYYIGRKISMIVGQYVVTTDDGYQFISNMAPGYAGMISALTLDQSSTCQAISIPDPSYEFTAFQLGQLTKAGFVTVKNSFTKGWVITDGITMAPAGSEFRRLSCSRITDYVSTLIREASEPFIGKENHLANQNSLRTAIKSKLDPIVGKYIEKYKFDLLIDNSQYLGVIKIPFKLVPIYEIKAIDSQVKVGSNVL